MPFNIGQLYFMAAVFMFLALCAGLKEEIDRDNREWKEKQDGSRV